MQSDAGFFLGFGLVTLLLLILGLCAIGFWLWMLIHSITNTGIEDLERVAWILAILFLPVVGSLVYFFVGRPKALPLG